jgi:hypothetical protein
MRGYQTDGWMGIANINEKKNDPSKLQNKKKMTANL